jgi:uncharacterized membrane protein
MNQYPDVVEKIADDYLARVKAQLRLLPAMEQQDFLREIQSHLHDAYDQMPGDDAVARILTVLRNFGEPADVVSDRLPGALMRTGTRRNLPLYIGGAILIALFGIPLGFGGFAVLLGILAALAGTLLAYYAFAGSLLLTGSIIMLLGLTRFLLPEFWESHGYIQLDGPLGSFLESLSPTDAGLFLMLVATVFLAAAWGMFRLGKYFVRGLRFVSSLTFDWIRRCAQSIRRKLAQRPTAAAPASRLSFVPTAPK